MLKTAPRIKYPTFFTGCAIISFSVVLVFITIFALYLLRHNSPPISGTCYYSNKHLNMTADLQAGLGVSRWKSIIVLDGDINNWSSRRALDTLDSESNPNWLFFRQVASTQEPARRAPPLLRRHVHSILAKTESVIASKGAISGHRNSKSFTIMGSTLGIGYPFKCIKISELKIHNGQSATSNNSVAVASAEWVGVYGLGACCNIIVYAIPMVLTVIAIKIQKKRKRFQLGGCMKCGYPQLDGFPCPECGSNSTS